MSDQKKLAATSTLKPQVGTWTLTAPDGRTWQGDSPMRVVAAEGRERVPAQVALARIMEGVEDLPTKRQVMAQVHKVVLAFVAASWKGAEPPETHADIEERCTATWVQLGGMITKLTGQE